MAKTQLRTENQNYETVAAIDVGSNMIRMEIGQFFPGREEEIEILERLQQAVHLGQDTFRFGRLGRRTMRAAISILKEYAHLLEVYKVENVRAVATSSVREASNSDTFIDRVYMATGLDLQIIDISEESRLTVSAVRHQISDSSSLLKKQSLIVEVGGGSTVLTVITDGKISMSQSLGLGSVRLKEALAASSEPWGMAAKIIKNEITTILGTAEMAIPFKKIQGFIAVGSDARFAAEHGGVVLEKEKLRKVTNSKLEKLIAKCLNLTPETLSSKYNLPFADAETLNPAFMIYQTLLKMTGAKDMVVSYVSMRDGLLLDIVRRITGTEDDIITQGVIESAKSIAEKYNVDLVHAGNVCDISMNLFDGLQSEHGLGFRQKLYLRAASIMHEAGTFISLRAYHKHTYYIISNSEIFGLTKSEVEMVAQIARYHRRARPKPTHLPYISLSREDRIIVNKLSAILRLATALDVNRTGQLRHIKTSIDDETLRISVPSRADITLTRRSAQAKSDMVKEIYGLGLLIEEMQ